MEPLENPPSSMNLEVVALGQFSAPRIINDHRCSKLGGLHDRLNFAAILCALASSFGEKEVGCSLFVAIATLEKRVVFKKRLQAIFRHPALEKLIAHSLWHEHNRKQKTQPRK